MRISKYLSRARTRALGITLAVVALFSMALASAAGATEPILTAAITKTESTFNENMPLVLGLMGVIAGILLAVSFYKKHAQKA